MSKITNWNWDNQQNLCIGLALVAMVVSLSGIVIVRTGIVGNITGFAIILSMFMVWLFREVKLLVEMSK